MDIQSYVSGFIQGILVTELLVCVIHLVISVKQSKQDLAKLDIMDKSIESDLRFSKAMVDAYNNQQARINKLEERLNKEDKDE